MTTRLHSVKTITSALLLTLMPLFGQATPAHSGELILLCGAGLRQPVEQLLGEFTRRTGIRVAVEYGGSGKLMVRHLATRRGDIFMPGSLFYIQKLAKKGHIISFSRVVLHTPVVAVNKKGAHKVRSLADLVKPGLRLALGDPKAMALGRCADEILKRSGLKKAVAKNVVVYGATVKQLALYVARGFVDAAIIGRADAFQNQKRVVMVPIPRRYYRPEVVAVAVLTSSADLTMAKRLAAFLSSPRAVKVFVQFGFLPLDQSER